MARDATGFGRNAAIGVGTGIAARLDDSLAVRESGGDRTVLRITCSRADDGSTTLTIEGRIAGDWVEELWQAASAAIAKSSELALDMAGVTFVDQGGVVVLRRLRDRGAELVGCSDFVRTLVNGEMQ